ncbi:hypothetical protein NBRC111894_1407 [Sporolactobacillus inulinus]|uniref:Uncharacterized protein n=1 Tax=Sporolactobacillus inulinus TaxID=2078 RepID=A0A4Y1ZAB0_9BACL|nr:hypothetical protein NBRC111894_1407 [Sporolactobacillus inulinus]
MRNLVPVVMEKCFMIEKIMSASEHGMIMRDYLKKEIRISRRAYRRLNTKAVNCLWMDKNVPSVMSFRKAKN